MKTCDRDQFRLASSRTGSQKLKSQESYCLMFFTRIAILMSACLVDVTRTQLIDWIVDFIPVSTNTESSFPTWVSRADFGESNMKLIRSLPESNSAMFSVTIFNSFRKVESVRYFSLTGDPLFSLNTNHYGHKMSLLKTVGNTYFTITSTHLTDQEDYCLLIVQPLSKLGNLFSTTGIRKTFTDERVTITADEPNTVYFYGVNLFFVRRYTTTGSSYLQSPNLGTFRDYPLFVVPVDSLSSVMAWFNSNATLAMISKTTLNLIRLNSVDGDIIDAFYLDPRTDRVFWCFKSPGTGVGVVQKRTISPSQLPILNTVMESGSFGFERGKISQVGSMNYLLLTPIHNHPGTRSSHMKLVYLIRQDNMEIISYNSGSNLSIQDMAGEFFNPAGPELAAQFYVGIVDSVSQNFQTYYMLLDLCMNFATKSLTCETCPSGYWRVAEGMSPVRRCLKPADFPPRTGMDNQTTSIKACNVPFCRSCTYDAFNCTLCDYESGFYLNPLPQTNPKLCLKEAEFPENYGIDQTRTQLDLCSDTNCIDCRASYNICVKCNTNKGFYLKT